jgi:Ca2+-binding RTX toxin-like protein
MRARWAIPLLAVSVLTLVALVPAPASAGGCTIFGTAGSDDNLSGTSGPDKICAFEGHDTVFGWGGDDVVTAGYGDDRVNGGKGDDVLKGGPGDDNLQAEDLVPDNDWDRGNGGDDICTADPGDLVDPSCETVHILSSIQTSATESIDSGAGEDIWSFTGAKGDEYGLVADTVAALTAFDITAELCKDLAGTQCFQFADDNYDTASTGFGNCSFAPPAFGCPELQGQLPTDGDGTYYIFVNGFGSDTGSYVLKLGEYIGTGFGALTLVQDEA